MNSSLPSLSSKQEQFITLLVAGIPIVHAAKQCSIAENTAHRWLHQSHVQQAYKAAQSLVFEQALSSLLLRVDKAINTLDKHMSNEETPAGVQVRASQLILEQAIQVGKMNAMEAEIQELKFLLAMRDD